MPASARPFRLKRVEYITLALTLTIIVTVMLPRCRAKPSAHVAPTAQPAKYGTPIP